MVWPGPQGSPAKEPRRPESAVRVVRTPETPPRRTHRKSASAPRAEPEAPRTTSEPNRLLSEMAPHLMTPSMVNALTKVSLQAGQLSSARDPYPLQRSTLLLAPRFSMENPARSLARISHSLLQFSGIGKGARSGAAARQPMTSMDVGVLEESQRILAGASADLESALDTAQLDGGARDEVPVSLLRGFQATVPQAHANQTRRRKVRAIASGHEDDKNRPRHERRKRPAGSEKKLLSLEELEQQNAEITEELRNVEIRRSLYNAEIVNVDAKIAALEAIKGSLQQKLLDVREEELELTDERTSCADRRGRTGRASGAAAPAARDARRPRARRKHGASAGRRADAPRHEPAAQGPRVPPERARRAPLGRCVHDARAPQRPDHGARLLRAVRHAGLGARGREHAGLGPVHGRGGGAPPRAHRRGQVPPGGGRAVRERVAGPCAAPVGPAARRRVRGRALGACRRCGGRAGRRGPVCAHARGAQQGRHGALLRRRVPRDGRGGQDAAPVGPRDGAVCAHDGHPLGDDRREQPRDDGRRAPRAAVCDARARPGRGPAREHVEPVCGPVLVPDAAVRGRELGDVPGLCRRRAVLGLCARERQRRRRRAPVGPAHGPGAPHAARAHGADQRGAVRRDVPALGQPRQDGARVGPAHGQRRGHAALRLPGDRAAVRLAQDPRGVRRARSRCTSRCSRRCTTAPRKSTRRSRQTGMRRPRSTCATWTATR